MVQYEIVSHAENYNESGETHVKVRRKYSRKTFTKPVSALYQKKWLDSFSGEDTAFIGVLYLADKTGDKRVVSNFPRKKHCLTKNVIFIGMLFISFLILSNLTAFKVVEIHLSQVPIVNHFFLAHSIFLLLWCFFLSLFF